MARVRVANVSKSYRRGEVQVFALRDVSFALADGEFVAVIGPSGSGKTTLLRTIAGLTEPDAGSVWFDDRDVTNVPSQDRRAGFVFQQYALYPHLSVYENIAFGPRARRLAANLVDARVRAVSARARLGAELLGARPRALSGGQQQRVALARALANEPAVMLLDEPLAGLDAPLRAELRLELSLLREAGAPALFVTHDQNEALALGRRVMVMNGGSIEQIGSARELYDRPCNTFVACFIGSPPMSLLRGTVESGSFRSAAGAFACLAPVADGSTLAGFRPEDVALTGEGTVAAVVRSIEDVGPHAFAYCEGDAGALVARILSDHRLSVGESVTLAPAATRAHFFDPATGLRR